jgi:transcriptional regulator with PAS, ATPase and Fis domain
MACLDASAVWSHVGDAVKGTEYAERALASALQSGHARTQVGALANLCFLSLQRGQHDAAEHYLAQAIPVCTDYPRIRMALLETATQIDLDRGLVDKALSRASELESWLEAADYTGSWLGLAASATRVRLLMATGQWDRAAHLSQRAFEAAEARGDRILSAVLRLLQGDALARAGQTRRAAGVVAKVVIDSGGLPSSTLAELLRLRTTLGVNQSPNRGAQLLRLQARLITELLGTTGARHDFVRDELAPLAGTARSLGAEISETTMAFGYGLESAVMLLALGSTPRVLLDCSLQLLRELDTVQEAEIIAGEQPTDSNGSEPGVVSVSATHGTSLLTLNAKPRDDGSVHLVSAIAKLTRAALDLEAHRSASERHIPLWPVEQHVPRDQGVFAAPAMRQLLATIDAAAVVPVTVLITGETGVGKEVIANEVHRRSGNPAAPFVAFNCASVPRDMLEGQLFGYRRGAFTGATESSPGIIRTASGGTLFLDEVGEMSQELQPKILRFLENREIHPLGEGRPLTVDVRIVAATNVQLERAVREGRFREDLYYRLNVVQLHVPPLRERREEIPLFVTHFLELYATEFRRAPLVVTDTALEVLLLHDWPGNVRQLANELRRLVALTPGGSLLTPQLLSEEVRTRRRPRVDPEIAVSQDEVAIRLDQPLDEAIAQLERALIARALERHGGSLETAAEMLGLSRKGLFLKRRRLGLE